MMYTDQVDGLGATIATLASDGPGSTGKAFDRLVDTVISGFDFDDNQLLQVEGQDRSGSARWRVIIRGSARFTFSHSSEIGSWLVEANFDAGGVPRRSEQSMILAMCGAVVKSFGVKGEALFIGSDDGRAIEVPYDLNEEGVVINILPDEAGSSTTRIVLANGLDDRQSGSHGYQS